MPKLKPHKGVKKRFRVTRNGKVVSASAFTGHIKSSKSAKRKRRLRGVRALSGTDAKRVKKLLGIM
jgi:large subunit ribosomal protein L35